MPHCDLRSGTPVCYAAYLFLGVYAVCYVWAGPCREHDRQGHSHTLRRCRLLTSTFSPMSQTHPSWRFNCTDSLVKRPLRLTGFVCPLCLQVGNPCKCRYREQWRAGHVLEVLDDGQVKVKLHHFSFFLVVDRSDLKVLETPLAQLETPMAQLDPSDELSSDGDAATCPVVIVEAINPPDVGEVSVASAAAIVPVAGASAVVHPPEQ